MKSWVYVAAPIAIFGLAVWYFTRDECDETAAYQAFQEKMASHLRSPFSAVYPDWEEVAKPRVKGVCIFDLKGYVDSANGFGAMIRTQFSGFAMKARDGEYSADVDSINGKLPGF